MTSSTSRDNETELRPKAQQIAQLQELIHNYPAEAQLIMSALEDGLTLGPAQAADAADDGDAAESVSARLGDEITRLPGPDPEWTAPAEQAATAGSDSD